MKLTDLINNREKLRKYDELSEWKEYFSLNTVLIDAADCTHKNNPQEYCLAGAKVIFDCMPDSIRQIIVNALEAEIQNLDKE